jgi:hypothetical protein
LNNTKNITYIKNVNIKKRIPAFEKKWE